MLFLVLLLLLPAALEAQTECNQQLHNYYVGLGMPVLTPVQQAFAFASGVLLGTPFVTLTATVQSVATSYANLLPNTTLANQTYTSFYSMDVPCCASDILFQCCSRVISGTTKTSNCTTLPDFDQGGASQVAGRVFIYTNQNATCQGNIVITFRNTTIVNSSTGTYTYDAVGIRDHIPLSLNNARNVYRHSTCLFTDGSPPTMVTQNQFVCTEQTIGCVTTCPNRQPAALAVPSPGFKCIGHVDNNSLVTTVMWDVVSLNPTTSVESEYIIAFGPDLNFGTYLQSIFDALTFQILVPSTLTQYDSGFPDFNHYAFLYYNGAWTHYLPQYPLSIDPIIKRVPCACGFTLVCLADNVTWDRSNPAADLVLNNVVPYCNAGFDTEIALGSDNFTLNGTESFDPDFQPYPFTARWALYSTPYSPAAPPFTLDPTALVQTINATGLALGTYLFVLYTSDLQTQTNCLVNITIIQPQVFAITEPNTVVLFTFYAGNVVNHSCFVYPPQPSISVSGNYSFSTLASDTLTYFWEQVDGTPLDYFCDDGGFQPTRAIFNTTEPFLEFVPPLAGKYGFRLIVSNGYVNSTAAYVQIQVNPNFGQPNSTFTPILNYTNPPLLFITPAPVPHFPFFNFTLPPFNSLPPTAAPTAGNSTPVPPLLPSQPPPTTMDYVALFVLGASIYVGLMLFLVMWREFRDVNEYRFLDKRIYGGNHSKLSQF